MKYYNYMVVFEEIPDEITLAINITNCPCRCKGCHSKFLWDDIGVKLTESEINRIIDENHGITCVCFMGGDAVPEEVNEFASYIKQNKQLKTAWYSGMDDISTKVELKNFDYIKIGGYDEKYGPLNSKTTNQKMFYVNGGKLEDITYKFW